MSIILSNIALTISTTHVIQQEMLHKQVTDIEISDVTDGALEAQLTFDNGETLEKVTLKPITKADTQILNFIEDKCFTADADSAIVDMEASNLKEGKIVIESVGFQYN